MAQASVAIKAARAISKVGRRASGAWLALSSVAALAQAPAVPATRGALLYDTHCVACHNSQMHWRDKKLVTDWESLKVQVRHWQGVAKLEWSEPDIVEVSRHLNDKIYRFPQTAQRLTLAPTVP